MRTIIAILVMSFSLVIFCTNTNAHEPSKFGGISIHTGFKSFGVATQVSENHWQRQTAVTGTIFNDAGEGPLHLESANCSDTFFMVGTHGKSMGFCTFGDAERGKIFVQYTGEYTATGESGGINEIIGGTGQYAGISGKGPWKCKPTGMSDALQCTEKFDYQLP